MRGTVAETATRRRRIWVTVLAVTVVIPFSWWGTIKYQHNRRLTQFQNIATAIEGGTLRPDRNGDITLPPSLSSVTKNGHVYVAQDAAGHVRLPADPRHRYVIFFPTRVDRYYVDGEDGRPLEWKYQIAGYLYAHGSFPGDEWVVFTDPHVDQVQIVDAEPGRPGWYCAQPWYS